MFFSSCCFFRLVGVDKDAGTIKVNTSPKSDFIVDLNCSSRFPFDRAQALLDAGASKNAPIVGFAVRENYYQPKRSGSGRYSMPLVIDIFDVASVDAGFFGWGV